MRVRRLTAVLLAGFTACTAGAAGSAQAQLVSSTFDSGLEGWTAVGFDIDASLGALLAGTVLSQTDNSLDMVYDAGGDLVPAFTGNGGGFARFTDVITDPGSFASAPAAFLGDLSGFLGGTFSFDHRLFNEGSNVTSIQPYVIAFISGDPNDLNAYGAVFPAPAGSDTGWVTLSTLLDAASLQPLSDINLGAFDPDFADDTIASLSGGLLTTTATLDTVMANVTQILVSFELVDNNSTQVSEAGGIDNVTLRAVPEPVTAACFGLAAAGLLRRRR